MALNLVGGWSGSGPRRELRRVAVEVGVGGEVAAVGEGHGVIVCIDLADRWVIERALERARAAPIVVGGGEVVGVLLVGEVEHGTRAEPTGRGDRVGVEGGVDAA